MDDYPWSSHTGYISSSKKWDWLYKEFLLGMFSQERQQARRQYKNLVGCEDSSEITKFFSKKNLPSFLGSPDFVDWVKDTYHQLQSNKEIPQSRLLAPTITEIKKNVCQYYKVEVQSLEVSKRGQTNEPRDVAVYLARKKMRPASGGDRQGVRDREIQLSEQHCNKDRKAAFAKTGVKKFG